MLHSLSYLRGSELGIGLDLIAPNSLSYLRGSEPTTTGVIVPLKSLSYLRGSEPKSQVEEPPPASFKLPTRQ